MNTQTTENRPNNPNLVVHDHASTEGEHGWQHWGLMLLCCLPMIILALLVIFGLFSLR